MAVRTRYGSTVRRLRREHGFTQAQLAERLLISPSYLNLIEHNQRALTVPLLIKLSDLLEVDLKTLSEHDEGRLIGELQEVVVDPVFDGASPRPDEIAEMAGAAPDMCRNFLKLYAEYRAARDEIQYLGDRLSEDPLASATSHRLRDVLTAIRSFSEILHDNADLADEERQRFLGIVVDLSQNLSQTLDSFLSSVSGEGLASMARTPASEASDFLEANDNYFDALEIEAQALVTEAKSNDALPGLLVARLHERFGISAKDVVSGPDGVNYPSFDAEQLTLDLPDWLEPGARTFQLARRLALVEHDETIRSLLADGGFSTDAGIAVAHDALAKYFAGAVLLPYDQFLGAAQRLRYDLELLQQVTGASFEQVCHRLTTLRRPGAEGVPFHFVRVDIAGNVSKRFNGSGLRIPHFGGLCPLWNIHHAFTAPGEIHTQLARTPDGSTFICIARAIAKPGAGRNDTRSLFAVGIGADASYARELVYADGLAIDDSTVVTPVGTNCRVCERTDCRQRVHPALVGIPAISTNPLRAGA